MSIVSTRDDWPALVADIGGTNARFGLVNQPGATVADIRSYACADYAGLDQAVKAYLDDASEPKIRTGCVAIAAPIVGDRLRFTNRAWDLSVEETRAALGLHRLTVLNDFVALAFSVPRLGPEDLVELQGGTPVPEQPIAVLGPGTGLGVAALVPCQNGWVAVSGEGGHSEIAPGDQREAEILRIVRGERTRLSAESVLSGAGLVRLYQATCTIDGLTAEALGTSEICEATLGGIDDGCVRALETFCALLGSFAGDVALTFGARGGVYIAGGILPRVIDFLRASDFRQRFGNKGRMSAYVGALPVQLILARYPALVGAAAWLEATQENRDPL